MHALKLSGGLKWLSLMCIAAGLAIHFTTDYALGGASPLALLVTGLCGWLLQRKTTLVGSILMLSAGGALMLFPFLNVTPIAYSPLALPLFAYGLTAAVQWWKEDS